MKNIILLLTFIVSSVLFGQSNLEPIITNDLISFKTESIAYNDIYSIGDHKIYVLRIGDDGTYNVQENSIDGNKIIASFENNGEIKSYSKLKISKTGNIYINNLEEGISNPKEEETYLIENNTLIPVEDYNNEEFLTNQLIERELSSTEIETLNSFFIDYYNDPEFSMEEVYLEREAYTKNNSSIFIISFQGISASDIFVIKITNNVPQLIHISSDGCGGGGYCSSSDYTILNDRLYILSGDEWSHKISAIQGTISNNFTLSNDLIQTSKEAKNYTIENNKVKALNANSKITIYNLAGQETENSSLKTNEIYLLNVTNLNNGQQSMDKIMIE